jgi:hypothetical protein
MIDFLFCRIKFPEVLLQEIVWERFMPTSGVKCFVAYYESRTRDPIVEKCHLCPCITGVIILPALVSACDITFAGQGEPCGSGLHQNYH